MKLDDLRAEAQSERRLIEGFTELLAIPKPMLSSDAQREVSEALAWSTTRIARLDAMIAAWSDLIDNGYPERQIQTVSDDVFSELNEQLENIQLAIAQFTNPLTVTSVVVES